MSLFKEVNVVYFYVTEWEAAKKFYREVLDWPVIHSDDDMGLEEYGVEGGTHVAIRRWDDTNRPAPENDIPTVALRVMDAYRATRILCSRGVHCDDVVSIPGVVTYGTFYDPEGNRIQFTSTYPAV